MGFKGLFTIGILLGPLGLLVSCSQQERTLPGNFRPPEKSAVLILEVTTTCRGAVYPREGEILNLRLFENGRFEYDDFPDYDPPRFTAENVPVTQKEGSLSKEDVAKLTSLAESDDFLSAKDRYEGIQPHVDTEWITRVDYKHGEINKSVVLVNFWDTQFTPSLKSHYPDSLVNLLEQVEIVKAKAIGRTSYQWLAKPKSASQTGNSQAGDIDDSFDS